MMREGKMSAQTFYDCKKSLTEKGVISSVEGQDDYDITLIGNDFTIYEKEDYEEGKVKYLSTTYHLFRDPYFRTLTRREQEIPHFYKWGMNCDKHGVFLTFMFHSIII